MLIISSVSHIKLHAHKLFPNRKTDSETWILNILPSWTYTFLPWTMLSILLSYLHARHEWPFRINQPVLVHWVFRSDRRVHRPMLPQQEFSSLLAVLKSVLPQSFWQWFVIRIQASFDLFCVLYIVSLTRENMQVPINCLILDLPIPP